MADDRLTRRGQPAVGELVQVRERCPGFTPHGVLARTGKSLLVTGTYQDAPAVAKLLTDPAPLWRAKFAAELHAYRVFAEHPVPVRTPRLLAGDATAGLLVLELITGRPAATSRHPTAPLPAGMLEVALAAVDALAVWTPPTGAFTAVFDYPERFTRYGPAGHGLLTSVDVDRLAALYDALHDEVSAKTTAKVVADGSLGPLDWAFAHGDVLLGNFLLTDSGYERGHMPTGPDSAGITSITAGHGCAAGGAAGCVLVDWEFAGLYLPGYDHALLWTLLHADPAARTRLRGRAGAGGQRSEAAFWVNAAMTLTREIRIHRELPVGAMARVSLDRRLAALTADLELARNELARLAA